MRWLKRMRRFLVWSFLILLLGVLGYWAFVNWDGGREWAEVKAELEERKISIVLADYAGPPIAEEDDLLLDPIFSREFEAKEEAALGDWREQFRETVVRSLTRLRPSVGETISYRELYVEKHRLGKDDLSESAACERFAVETVALERRVEALSQAILAKPARRFFARQVCTGEISDEFSHLQPLSEMSKGARSSGLLALRQGDHEKALQRVLMLQRLSQMTEKSTLVEALVSYAHFGVMTDLIWEGVRLRVWTDEELIILKSLLGARDFGAAFQETLKCEFAWALAVLDDPKTRMEAEGVIESSWLEYFLTFGGPQGWKDYRRSAGGQVMLTGVDSAKAVQPSAMAERESQVYSQWKPYLYAQQVADIGMQTVEKKYREAVSLQRIALIVLTAEQFQRATGRYPIKLKELGGDLDLIDFSDPEGRIFGYELGPQGRPVIWSKAEEGEEKPLYRRLRWQFWHQEFN